MINKTVLGLMTTTFLAVVSSTMSGNALAADDHSYNGSYCKARYGSEAGLFDTDHVGITNNTTSTRFITCPIHRDQTDAFYGIDVGLYWVAASPIDTLTCFVYYRDLTGNTYTYSIRSLEDSGSLVLPITGGGLANDMGHYNLVCGLPQYGSLRSVYVREYTSYSWLEVPLQYTP